MRGYMYNKALFLQNSQNFFISHITTTLNKKPP